MVAYRVNKKYNDNNEWYKYKKLGRWNVGISG